MGLEVGTALLISSLITAAAAGTSTAVQGHQSEKALSAQKEAQAKAEAQQKKADTEAETKRLEGIASNATATDYGNIWAGADSNKYKDAAQKLSAGTGSFNTDEDENPFYTRGLI